MIEKVRKNAVNALSYVETIDELLVAETNGTLAESWANINSIPSPIQEVQEGQEKEKGDEATS